MSLFFGINIALKGMMAQQAALDVASHNIANANTPGYSRQRVTLQTSPPISGLNCGQLGSGVDTAEITRIRDLFLDYQVRKEASSLEKQQVIYEALQMAENVFMEPSPTGFNNKLDTFWNAWQELSRTPDSSPVRTALKEASVSLTDALRQMHGQLTDIKIDAQSQIDLQIREVNSIAERIAVLNQQIVYVQMTGQNPNDLYDKRDLALDELAALGNIAVTDSLDGNGRATGALEVKFGGLDIVAADGPQAISRNDIDSLALTDGSLAGLLQISGDNDQPGSIQYYMAKLDTLAAGIAKTINDLHHTGLDLAGGVGQDYFIFQDAGGNIIDLEAVDWDDPWGSGLGAAGIYVNPAIAGNVSLIAASPAGDLLLEGNGGIALKIAQLKDTWLQYDPHSRMLKNQAGDITIGMFYQNLITDLGSAAGEAEKRVENQQTLVNQIINRRESMQGVSVDEEVANMVIFQHSFDASAKVISIIDQMLDTIIHGLKA